MKKQLTILLLITILASSIFIGTSIAAPAELKPVIVGFRGLPDAALIHAHGGQNTYQYSLIHAIACNLPTQAITALQNNPNVAFVEDDFEAMALEYGYPTEDWGITKIAANTVHTSYQGLSVKVAVIDTGINWKHEDLIGRYVGGYDYVNNDADPMDDNGHGTHCSGIIAANLNQIAVVGVAPQASIYSYKVLNRQGSGYISNIIKGIQQAVADGVDVISMSLGSSSYSQSLYDACAAAKSSGVVVVCAAGNSGNTPTGSTVNYPGKFDCVIAVGATAVNDVLATWSSTGPEVDVAAPGVYILSDYLDVTPSDGRNVDVIYMSGTSMACPHVAGAAALMLSANSALSPTQVQTILEDTALDKGAPGVDNYYGHGRINADAAVARAKTEPPPPPQPTMHVESVAVTLTSTSKGTYATATVTIRDATEAAVSGAKVTGQWKIGTVTYAPISGTTGSTGTATLKSSTIRNAKIGTTFTFTVTNVVKSGYVFVPGPNDSGSKTK